MLILQLLIAAIWAATVAGVTGIGADGVPLIDRTPTSINLAKTVRAGLVKETAARRARIAKGDSGLAPADLFALAEALREQALLEQDGRLRGWKPPKCPRNKRCYPASYFRPKADYRKAIATLRALLVRHPGWARADQVRHHLAVLLDRGHSSKHRGAAVKVWQRLVTFHRKSAFVLPARFALGRWYHGLRKNLVARPHLEAVCASAYLFGPYSCRDLAKVRAKDSRHAEAIKTLLVGRANAAKHAELSSLIPSLDRALLRSWTHIDGGWEKARDHLKSAGVDAGTAIERLMEMANDLRKARQDVAAIALLEHLRAIATTRKVKRKIDRELKALRRAEH